MKKILFILPTLNIGGAERLVVNIINQLNKKYEVFLLVLTDKNILQPELIIDEKKIFFLNSPFETLSLQFSSLKDIFLYIKKIKEIIINNEINIVFANLPIAHFMMRMVKLSFLNSKIDLICVHHSLQYKANPLISIKHKVFNFFNNILSLLLDKKNIFVSSAVKDDITSNFHIASKKQEVILNSIKYDENYSEFNPFEQFKTNYNIVIVGRLVHEKGYFKFLDNLKVILEENNLENIKVFILGDGPLKSELETYIKALNLDNYVYLLGFKKNTLVKQYFKYSNLVIIPSIVEGFGLVALEAIYSKAIVLSSYVGGLKDIIEDEVNGFFYKSDEEFKEKFLAIKNKQISIDLEKAFTFTSKKFSIENTTNKYISVIEIGKD